MLRRTAYLASIAFLLSVLLSTGAMATAQRTFVASTGSPANTAFNCSLVKPCRAFSDAINVTNAGGEVIVLDSAGYGSVTITKAVSLISPPGIYAGISVFSGNDGVTINAGASDIVVLRGLSINGQGGNRGIFFQSGARLRVENCVISGMAVAGISHNAASAEMIVLDTIVRDNGGSGIVVFGDIPYAVLDHVRIEHNGGDGFNFGPTAGSIGAVATVVDSVFTHNEGKGIGAASVIGGTITIVVERSVMASNGQDGFAASSLVGSSAAVTVARSMINDNGGDGLSIAGDGVINVGVQSSTAHRNSGTGFHLHGTHSGPTMVVVAKDNMAGNNLGFDLLCSGGFALSDHSNLFNQAFAAPECIPPAGGVF